MHRDDLVRLRHMIDAAREALSFVQHKSREALDADRILTLALVKSIEIIGEAASRVTTETRDRHPEIPWTNIVGMRNRLIHAYFDVDVGRVWDTVTGDLPPLVAALEMIVVQTEGAT